LGDDEMHPERMSGTLPAVAGEGLATRPHRLAVRPHRPQFVAADGYQHPVHDKLARLF
jgi:hypothetical protein